MVPSANSLCHASIHSYPHRFSLRQVSRSLIQFVPVTLLTLTSFYNIEQEQIRPELAVEIHFARASGITGHVMLLCMMLMYTTAHHRIRQQAYETFWYAHHLFIPFMLALYTHATGCFVRDVSPLLQDKSFGIIVLAMKGGDGSWSSELCISLSDSTERSDLGA
jgi:hypothetical protein